MAGSELQSASAPSPLRLADDGELLVVGRHRATMQEVEDMFALNAPYEVDRRRIWSALAATCSSTTPASRARAATKVRRHRCLAARLVRMGGVRTNHLSRTRYARTSCH
jgi:hypothetical protein